MRRINSIIFYSLLLSATSAWADTTSVFTLPSGVAVKITESVFKKSEFKVTGCVTDEEVCRINEHIPFGVLSGLPKTFVKSITVSFKDKSYSLNVMDMYDAWGARTLQHSSGQRYFGGNCNDSKNCQFRGIFSDASGTFVAEWRIVNGLPVRTILTDSNDVVDLFMKQIDPAEFE